MLLSGVGGRCWTPWWGVEPWTVDSMDQPPAPAAPASTGNRQGHEDAALLLGPHQTRGPEDWLTMA